MNVMDALIPRLAAEADIPAIDALRSAYRSPEEDAARHLSMGLDTQLIADRTYVVVEAGDRVAGCGGWSDRATLYGGDHSETLRHARAAGLARAELMATLAGEPPYFACGYHPIERVQKVGDAGPPVPGVRMGKTLI